MPKPQQEYKEQVVTILGITQDVVKQGANKGNPFERYDVEGDGRTFYNFHSNHLLGEVQGPVKARIRYIDDSKRPKVEEIELVDGELEVAHPHYPVELSASDVLKTRLGNIEHSLKAIEHVPGSFEEKLKAYKQLLEENDEYLFEGLHQRKPDDGEKL